MGNTERLIFNQAISCQSELKEVKHIDSLLELYPWFDVLKMMKLRVMEGAKAEKYLRDNALVFLSNSYYNVRNSKSYSDFALSQSHLKKKQYYNSEKTSSGESGLLIDSFLKIDLSKIKVEDVDNKYVNVDLAGDVDDNLISEDIAAVYIKLGDYQEAEKIYCKLSLKYPEKSAYFAEVLENIKKNK